MLSLPEGTEMFHFPPFASGTYGFSAGSRGFAAGGFPIRRSPGQSLFGGSPELIAACHVLPRLLTPRHPPCALIHLITTQRMKLSDAFTESVVKEPGTLSCRRPSIGIRISKISRSMIPTVPVPVGGGERDRTDGLLVANQALSQLSYTPNTRCYRSGRGSFPPCNGVPRPTRVSRGGPR